MKYEKDKNYSTREACAKKLVELGKKYRNLIVFDADLAESTYTKLFRKEFPDRFYDCGVAEANMAATAIGAASEGMIPVADTFAVFANRCADQVYQGLRRDCHVIFRFTHGGFVGEDGPSHHGINDITIMSSIPGMYAVIEPCDAIQAEKAIEWAVEKNKHPVYIRTHRDKTPIYMPDNYRFGLGKGFLFGNNEKNKQKENDIVIFATSPYMMKNCLKARDNLGQEGIKTSVVSMPTIKPMKEKEIKKYVGEKTRVVTTECSSVRGGLGYSVGRVLGGIGVSYKIIGIEDDYYGFSDKTENLLRHAGLDADSITAKILDFYKK